MCQCVHVRASAYVRVCKLNEVHNGKILMLAASAIHDLKRLN